MAKRLPLDEFLEQHPKLSMKDMYNNQGEDLVEVLNSSVGNIYTVYRDPKDLGRVLVMKGLRFADTQGFFLLKQDEENKDES